MVLHSMQLKATVPAVYLSLKDPGRLTSCYEPTHQILAYMLATGTQHCQICCEYIFIHTLPNLAAFQCKILQSGSLPPPVVKYHQRSRVQNPSHRLCYRDYRCG